MRKPHSKPHKKNAVRQAPITWIDFFPFIVPLALAIFLIPSRWANDLSLPWVIGPAAWLATIAATISFLRSLVTRRGLTAGSLFSCVALAAFVVAGTVYFWAPSTGPLLTLLLAQLSSAIICIMLVIFLRKVQIGMDPIRNVEIRSQIDLQSLRKGLLGGTA